MDLLLSALAVIAVGSIFIAYYAGRGRGSREAEAIASEQLAALGGKRDAAEKRAREAQQESTRWKGASLAGEALTMGTVFDERPAPRDAEALAGLARGLTFVDDVVIADRSGYPLTRESDAASADLASLAGHVFPFCRAMALEGFPVHDAVVETLDATHVAVRPLGGRGDGMALVVKTTSQRVNPLVMDAVFHAARSATDELPSGVAPLTFQGSNDRHLEEGSNLSTACALLERQMKGDHDLKAIAILIDERVVFSAAEDGPLRVARERAAAALQALAAAAKRVLRADGIDRIDVALRGGFTMTWAAVSPRSRFSVVAFGPTATRSSARLDRIRGSLRRQIELGSLPTAQRETS